MNSLRQIEEIEDLLTGHEIESPRIARAVAIAKQEGSSAEGLLTVRACWAKANDDSRMILQLQVIPGRGCRPIGLCDLFGYSTDYPGARDEARRLAAEIEEIIAPNQGRPADA